MISTNRIVQLDKSMAIHGTWVINFNPERFFSKILIGRIHCNVEGVQDPRNSMSAERRPGNIPVPHRPMNLGLDMGSPRKQPQPQQQQQPLIETKTDYGKYR